MHRDIHRTLRLSKSRKIKPGLLGRVPHVSQLLLMARNVGLLKHASNVLQCALAIEQVFRRAGFAERTFQTLLIGSERVNELIADSRISAVTLTGGVGAGSSLASARTGRN